MFLSENIDSLFAELFATLLYSPDTSRDHSDYAGQEEEDEDEEGEGEGGA